MHIKWKVLEEEREVGESYIPKITKSLCGVEMKRFLWHYIYTCSEAHYAHHLHTPTSPYFFTPISQYFTLPLPRPSGI